MSDLEVLWAVLGGLYLWECLCWVPREAVAFLSRNGRRWRIGRPPTLTSNRNGGFILTHILPPLGYTVMGHPVPISASGDGIFAYVSTSLHPRGRSTAQTCEYVPFSRFDSAETAGRKVKVNGRVLLKAASVGQATELARRLRQLAGLRLAERQKAIHQWFASVLDADAVQQRWAEFRAAARSLRWLSNSLFVFLFLLAPLAIRFIGFSRCWPFLLAGLIALTLTTAVAFRKAHRALYPAAADERFTQSLTIFLAPTSATRAVQTLSRPLLQDFHPLAIAKALCSPEQFRSLAQAALLDVRFPALPACPIDHPGAATVEQEARAAWVALLDTFLRKSGIEPEDLLQAPAPADETCQSYCPRCRAQFVWPSGQCADCGGIPLLPLPRLAAVPDAH